MASQVAAASSEAAAPVRVYLRVRPQTRSEAVALEAAAESAAKHALTLRPTEATMRGKPFGFDGCFGDEADQAAVYAHVGPALLEAATSGINASLLAYGQSGSGKTHSMFGDLRPAVSSSIAEGGDPEDIVASGAGIVPRLLGDLFKHIRRCESQTVGGADDGLQKYTVTARMFEVYCEKAYDMLASSTADGGARSTLKRAATAVPLRIRDGGAIDGITETVVSSAEAALAVLSDGMGRRTTATTHRNDRSSRSHAVLQLRVVKEVFTTTPAAASTTDDGGPAKAHCTAHSSLLSLVDLAGSERYTDAAVGGQGEGDRLKEMVKINLSLSTLRRVIQSLAARGSGSTNAVAPPYRDSLLTRALTTTFGGNSRTAMVVTASPAVEHADDTFGSLQFGAVARRVVNKTAVNVSEADRVIGAMKDEITSLKLQLAQREAELAAKNEALEALAAEAEAAAADEDAGGGPALVSSPDVSMAGMATQTSVRSRGMLLAAPTAAAGAPSGLSASSLSIGQMLPVSITESSAYKLDVERAAKAMLAAGEADVIGSLKAQLVRLEALQRDAENDREEHDQARFALLADLQRKDDKIVSLRRRLADAKRQRRRDLDEAVVSRPGIAEAMTRIVEPLQKVAGCPACLASNVEASTLARKLARLEAEAMDAEESQQAAEHANSLLEQQVDRLVSDLLMMQRKLEASGSLQLRCDEQAAMLALREEQIAKYLEDISRLMVGGGGGGGGGVAATDPSTAEEAAIGAPSEEELLVMGSTIETSRFREESVNDSDAAADEMAA